MGKPERLENKKILVACSAKKMSALADGLKKFGAEVSPLPVIEIRGVKETAPLEKALNSLPSYDWIIFTSAHGVVHFFQHLNRDKNSGGVPETLKFCAIGPATAQTLKEYGLEPDLVPERFVAEGVIEAFERHVGGRKNLNGIRVLFPRARVAREVLPEALVSAGVQLDVVVCYETVKAELSRAEIHSFKEASYDLIVFTSSSTVTNTLETFGYDEGRRMILRSAVAAIGPVTAGTLKSFGKDAEIVPKESTIPSLIEAVAEYFKEHRSVRHHG